jgi:hypothetical protein
VLLGPHIEDGGNEILSNAGDDPMLGIGWYAQLIDFGTMFSYGSVLTIIGRFEVDFHFAAI